MQRVAHVRAVDAVDEDHPVAADGGALRVLAHVVRQPRLARAGVGRRGRARREDGAARAAARSGARARRSRRRRGGRRAARRGPPRRRGRPGRGGARASSAGRLPLPGVLDERPRRRHGHAVFGVGAAAEADLVELEGRPVRRGREPAGVAHRAPVAAVERRDVGRPRVVGLVVGPLVDVARHVEAPYALTQSGWAADAVGLPEPRELALARVVSSIIAYTSKSSVARSMLHGLGCRTKPHGNGRRFGPSQASIHSERRQSRFPAPAQRAFASNQST